MRSKHIKQKRSNNKRLNRGSNRNRRLTYFILGSLVIGFILFGKIPTTRRDSPDTSETQRLKALPYLAWTPAKNASKSGIVWFDREKSFTGINIYKSDNAPEAFLMDMDGNIVHTWTGNKEEGDTWSNIELTNQGDLIAFVNYEKLVSLDWNSNINWESDKLGFHHDLAISSNGDIYALTRKIEYIPKLSRTQEIANDYITILDKYGKQKKSLSIAKLLLDAGIPVIRKDIEADYPRDTGLREFIDKLENITGHSLFIRGMNKIEHYYAGISRPKDFFHTNTINLISDNLQDNSGNFFKEGDVLICIRNQNLLAIVDIEREKIIWSGGRKIFQHPHDATILDNGNILVFDNGYKRKFSRIIELNPETKKISWEYKSTPPEDFYSETRGSNQKLGNGNILIADSRNGHAFEITRDGEVVWEFYNPEMKSVEGEQQRATIFRIRRLDKTKSLPLLP